MANTFNVLDMAQQYADNNETDISEIFKQHPVSGKVKAEAESSETVEEQVPVETPKKKRAWAPDISDLPEMNNQPVTYAKDEIRVEEHNGLKNIADDNALQDKLETMDELHRTHTNIEECKKRRGIIKLQIPPGEWHAKITAAAGDTNFKRAQKNLNELFDEIERDFPDFIIERVVEDEPSVDTSDTKNDLKNNINKLDDVPVADTNDSEIKNSESVVQGTDTDELRDTKIIIDKSQLNSVAWSPEEIEKIRKSRSIELNIVESQDLEFSSIIEDVPANAIDAVLAPYQRKTNDVTAALPASKYRATFTGLTYTEVIDLSNSTEMNNLDGELKKWSICFNHIKNPSIGPWEEYQWYIDPISKKKVKIPITASIPPGINPDTVHEVTKFQDFLMKTSFMDLEFMLWKVLCATTRDKEIISIDCHAMHNGSPCNKNHDWVYAPTELLMMDSIDRAVLEDMKKTGEANTSEEILANYKTSPVAGNNVVKLPTSGISVVFGHCSAYDYIDSVYGLIKSIEETDEKHDPSLASKGLAYTTLTVVKAFLIPNENGYYSRITGSENLVKVINTLDEVDWQTLYEIVRLMIEPYQFRYALNNIVCPQCHSKSSIPIDSMSRLLFIVARSLQITNVTLKRI